MKHLLRGLFIAVLIICCNFQSVFAQPMQQMPVDKNVRIGKLDNGLTYYIRHNALPEKRVEFYIAQKVGSILEEPQQRGLAHFLEHMAFNGTKHFPGDETGRFLPAYPTRLVERYQPCRQRNRQRTWCNPRRMEKSQQWYATHHD